MLTPELLTLHVEAFWGWMEKNEIVAASCDCVQASLGSVPAYLASRLGIVGWISLLPIQPPIRRPLRTL